jgi:hypothetical protein
LKEFASALPQRSDLGNREQIEIVQIKKEKRKPNPIVERTSITPVGVHASLILVKSK